MKTFREFIFICENILIEKRGSEPDYNYEVALVRLYNYLIKGDDKENEDGKKLRKAISDGDNDIIKKMVSSEIEDAKNNPNHPLHFDNAPDEGFTGKKKTLEHKKSYYKNLEDQGHTVLNDFQSRTGKSLASKGFIAKGQGEEKVNLGVKSKTLYGKERDTSKPDVIFYDPEDPKKISKVSLKKASGAVSASSGAEETYGNMGLAIDSFIKKAIKSGKISKNEADKLKFSGMSIAGSIRNIMRDSKGKDQKELLPKVQEYQKKLEDLFPGVSKEIGLEQMSGSGKYGSSGGVSRYVSTGEGGGTVEDPRKFSIKQRARQGKGTTKTKEGPKQRPMVVTGDISKATTGKQSSFVDFSKRAAQSQRQLAQAEKNLEVANIKAQNTSVPIDPDTGKPIPARFRATAIQNMAADPTSRTAKINNARREKSQSIITKAQSKYDNAAASHQETQSTLDAIQQNKQPQQQTPPPEQQPQQSAAPTTPSEPTQPPQQTPAQEQQPQQQPEPSGPKTAAQQAAELGLTGDGHGRWYDNKGNVAAETEGDILKRTAPLKPKLKNTGTAERMDAAGKKLGLPDS